MPICEVPPGLTPAEYYTDNERSTEMIVKYPRITPDGKIVTCIQTKRTKDIYSCYYWAHHEHPARWRASLCMLQHYIISKLIPRERN